LVMELTNVFVGALLIAGATRMRRLETYELAGIVSVLALLPVTGVVWLGTLPVGGWGLWVLLKPGVRAAVAPPLRQRPPAPARPTTSPPEPPAPTGPVRRQVRALLRSVRALVFDSVERTDAPMSSPPSTSETNGHSL